MNMMYVVLLHIISASIHIYTCKSYDKKKKKHLKPYTEGS